MLKMAQRLKDLQRYDEALLVAHKTILLYPASRKAKYIIEEIKSLRQEKKWAQQRQKQVSGAKDKKNSTRFKLNRIKCLSLKGDKGLRSCNAALETAPEDPALHRARGDILLKMGRNADAKSAYVAALQLAPNNPAYQKKVNLWVKSGQPAGSDHAEKTPTVHGAVPKPLKTPSPAKEKIIGEMALLRSLYDKSLISQKEYSHRKKLLLDSAFKQPKSKPRAAETPSAAGIDFGKYHALVIGIQDYQYLPKLQTAKNDAAAVARVLEKDYGFKVKRLYNATRRKILLTLTRYRKNLGPDDNLLIYYAGHGWLDKEADTGYWLPVNAVTDNDVDWLSLNTITSSVRAIASRHVMIVADSCYSGKLTRGIHVKRRTPDYFTRIIKKRARVVLTSGGLEPVLDSGGDDDHSVFASAFLNALKDNHGVIDGTMLFTKIRRPVMLKASQTPEYADIRRAGHEGGDFIFVRTR